MKRGAAPVPASRPIRSATRAGNLHRRVRVLDDNDLDELAMAVRRYEHTLNDDQQSAYDRQR